MKPLQSDWSYRAAEWGGRGIVYLIDKADLYSLQITILKSHKNWIIKQMGIWQLTEYLKNEMAQKRYLPPPGEES